jgi:hypothetical protein
MKKVFKIIGLLIIVCTAIVLFMAFVPKKNVSHEYHFSLQHPRWFNVDKDIGRLDEGAALSYYADPWGDGPGIYEERIGVVVYDMEFDPFIEKLRAEKPEYFDGRVESYEAMDIVHSVTGTSDFGADGIKLCWEKHENEGYWTTGQPRNCEYYYGHRGRAYRVTVNPSLSDSGENRLLFQFID